MKFGLDDAIMSDLRALLSRTKGIKRAMLFGSRGRGDFGAASDVDLAIEAPAVSSADFATLCAALEAIPMVFKLDIVRLDDLANPLLRDRIERDGISILDPES